MANAGHSLSREQCCRFCQERAEPGRAHSLGCCRSRALTISQTQKEFKVEGWEKMELYHATLQFK